VRQPASPQFSAPQYDMKFENLHLDADPDDVGAIVATFSQDLTTHGRPAHAAPGRHLVWSPAARQVFLKRIEAARHTLDVTRNSQT
jgi:cardiolipin synthase A/B